MRKEKLMNVEWFLIGFGCGFGLLSVPVVVSGWIIVHKPKILGRYVAKSLLSGRH